MQCKDCGTGMVQVASRTWTCPECGGRVVELHKETTDATQKWMETHPFREIPNKRQAPLFTTDDPKRLQAVLDWAERHPGKPVPQTLLDAAAMTEEEITRVVFGLMAKAGLLRKKPAVAWAYLRTGLLASEETFDNLLLDRRFEYQAALEEWQSLPPALQKEFVAQAEKLGKDEPERKTRKGSKRKGSRRKK